MNTENPTTIPSTPKNIAPWKTSLWLVLLMALCLVIITFLSAIITGFTWALVVKLFEAFWLGYLVLLAFVYILLFAFFSSIYKMMIYSFLGIAFLLVCASEKGNWIADKVRGYIDANFDFNYLIGGFAIFGIALALSQIKKKAK